jgi:glycine/D-amino acid oxidase-like deaminating enzyme/nitrite reductase/ring-hydroxylating ferredoxin subunit
MQESESSRSVWRSTAELPTPGPLRENLLADVCIVGAGIAGLSTAYFLTGAGQRVVVLDKGPIGGGETGQTTAHLSSVLDDRFVEIERMHGLIGSRLAFESHQRAIERIDQVVAAEGIDCDFERLDGYLFLAADHGPELLEEELDAARRAGFAGAARLERVPLHFSDTGPCLRFPGLGQFHPLRYLGGLARAIVRDGGRIHTGSMATVFQGGRDAIVETEDGFSVRAGSIVVATNSPVNDRVAVHTRQAPYRTFAIAARVPQASVPPGLFWDTADPYHYVRLQREDERHDLLIVGGEDHKTGQADDAVARYARLESWARLHFPMMQEVAFRWSGQVLEPVDGLAYIGRNPRDDDNVFIATGDSGHGMTHGTIAGLLLTDLILERENPWAELYSPGRVRANRAAVAEFVRENVNVAAQYTDWLKRGDVAEVDEIAPGSGAVLQRGLQKLAVYRDPAGEVHERSAVCTHLGCVVRWNGDERSWDCPCHGSRFSPTGEVLTGPAKEPLAEPRPSRRD